MNFVAAWFFAHWKIHHVLFLAAIAQIIGTWVRCLSFIGDEPEGKFWILALGTFIFYLVNPFILNSISIVSNMWFAENELARSTAISGLMAPFGSLLGLAVAGVFSSGVDTEDPVDCFNRLKKIVYTQNIIYTTTCVLLLIFFREKPTEPPSKLSLTFKKLSQYGILEDMKTLIKNRNFLYCMLCFTIVWGSYITLGNCLTPMFSKQFNPA